MKYVQAYDLGADEMYQVVITDEYGAAILAMESGPVVLDHAVPNRRTYGPYDGGVVTPQATGERRA